MTIRDEHNDLGMRIAMWWLRNRQQPSNGQPLTFDQMATNALVGLFKTALWGLAISAGVWFFSLGKMPQYWPLYVVAVFLIIRLLHFLWHLFVHAHHQTAAWREESIRTAQQLGDLAGSAVGAATMPATRSLTAFNNQLELINAAAQGRPPVLNLSATRGALPSPPLSAPMPMPPAAASPMAESVAGLSAKPAQKAAHKVPVHHAPDNAPTREEVKAYKESKTGVHMAWSPTTLAELMALGKGDNAVLHRHYAGIGFPVWEQYEGEAASAHAFLAAHRLYHKLKSTSADPIKDQRLPYIRNAWEGLSRLRDWPVFNLTSENHFRAMTAIAEADKRKPV